MSDPSTLDQENRLLLCVVDTLDSTTSSIYNTPTEPYAGKCAQSDYLIANRVVTSP